MERALIDSLASSVEKTSSIVKTISTTTANYTLVPIVATAELSLSPLRYLLLSKRSEAVRGERLPSQDCPQLECQHPRSVQAATKDTA